MAADESLVARIRARAKQQGGRRGLRRRPPVWQNPDAYERQYRRLLLSIVGQIRDAVESIVIAGLPPIAEQAQQERPGDRFDAWPDDLDRLITRLSLKADEITRPQAYDPELQQIARDVARFNKQQFQRISESVLGVNIVVQEPYLAAQLSAFEKQNRALIKKLTADQVGDIEGVAMRGLQRGRRIEDVTQDILKRVDVAESRARLIARDQVQKLNSNLTELRQREVGVESYIWRTSRDERVRDSHKAHNGKRFQWDDPPSSTGHPGEDVNCRCYAEPDFEAFLESAGIA